MELSRLSNSLGSVCSQRRGRLAAVVGRPRLPRSLSHRSAPLPPELLERLSVFVCVFLSHCAHEHAPLADPRGVLCSLVLNAARRPLTPARSPTGGQSHPHNGPLSAGLWLSAALHPPSSKTPNLRSEGGGGTRPSEGAHCFSSCPLRHPPRRLCPTGSQRRVWSQREVW